MSDTQLTKLAEVYLRMLIVDRGQPGLIPEGALASIRNRIAMEHSSGSEYIQTAFELVADVMRGSKP